jgi:ketosteroid isomerase-like protein
MTSTGRSLGALLRSDEDPEDSPEKRRKSKDLVLAFFRAIAAKDPQGLAEALSPDALYEIPFSESGSTEPGAHRRYVGRDQVVDFWMQTASAGTKNLGAEELELSITADGGRLFIEQRGNMVMADGKSYRNRYVFRFEFENGKIKSVREYYNPVVSAYAFGRPIAGSIQIDKL